MKETLKLEDYPLSEKRPDLVRGQRGKKLADVTLEGLLEGDVEMADLCITSEALRFQAEISRAANRPTLAENFERAAELVDVPQELIMEVYELLRPGRARAKQELLDAAERLRSRHGAAAMAAFIEEAAEIYERRGLFTYRF